MDGNTADEAAKFITHFCGDIHQPLQLRCHLRHCHCRFQSIRVADTLAASHSNLDTLFMILVSSVLPTCLICPVL
jgi:hypothetical protein